MITPTLELERELAAQGYDLIVGFDEVGRGALAGPVMVGCAAIWARDLEPLNDTDRAAAEGESDEALSDTDRTAAGVIYGEACNDADVPKSQFLTVPDGVADSKLLTEHRREAIYDELCDWCAAWAVGQASNTEIDDWGITYALGIAALRALADVERQLGLDGSQCGTAANNFGSPLRGELSAELTEGSPRTTVTASATASAPTRPIRVGAILDGPSDYITKALGTFDAPDVPIPAVVTTKVKGDRSCATVASAAVIAKVTRDRLMVDLAQSDPKYAPYEWAHNKGYGSAAHRAAIAEHGPTALHRVSWHLT
ncbi:ribonuclease HII [Bifidobacterium callitrichidarum]|uniref:Ribonuclease n=1 Tax=Bifidobacterium callitrichidarum TaxID=2052941 RepID=A0A2U2N4X0_9BIFI|nr:ribonuclease HII [Bifidobacterium callitrichidarum]PWG64019.1 ribonuclease HII [Bifidobacterium callitrichidarum]